MTFDEFKQNIADGIKDHLPEKYEDAEVRIAQVTKNNDKVLDGLTILLPDSNVSPNIYLNSYYEDYENGRDMEDILDTIAKIRTDNEIEIIDVSHMSEWEHVKDQIVARICSEEKNQQRLSDMPHTSVEDLAVTYHIVLNENNIGTASIPITNALLGSLGVSLDELHDTAMANMGQDGKVMFMSMSDFMREMLFADIPPGMGREEAEKMVDSMLVQDDKLMYILTNDSRTNGAGIILNDDIRQMVAEKVSGDYFVLPSSIHECLIVPKDSEMDYRELESLVRDINEAQVAPDERLSNHVYEYDALEHEFMRSDKAEERKLAKVADRIEDKIVKSAEKLDRPSLKEKLEAKKLEAAGIINDNSIRSEHRKEAALA